jgi:hypothetical protein
MILNFFFGSVHAILQILQFAFLHIALFRYDHDDTGQAASTVMDILISKKRSLEFVTLFFIFIVSQFVSHL